MVLNEGIYNVYCAQSSGCCSAPAIMWTKLSTWQLAQSYDHLQYPVVMWSPLPWWLLTSQWGNWQGRLQAKSSPPTFLCLHTSFDFFPWPLCIHTLTHTHTHTFSGSFYSCTQPFSSPSFPNFLVPPPLSCEYPVPHLLSPLHTPCSTPFSQRGTASTSCLTICRFWVMMTTRPAWIVVTKQQGHTTSHFITASPSDGNSCPNDSCNFRIHIMVPHFAFMTVFSCSVPGFCNQWNTNSPT